MRAIARRHAYVLLRSPHRLFDVTLWPLVDVVLFGSLAAFVGTSSASGTSKASGYLLVGIVLWHVIYQSQIAMSTGLLEETWTRNLLNLMVTPLREVEYLGGVALFGMVKLVIGVGVMVLGALAFFSFHTWSLGWGLVPIVAILLVVGWAISLFVMGLVLRFGTGAEASESTPAWLQHAGEQDITSHVDFTSVQHAAHAEELATLGFLDQTYFLMGILNLLNPLNPLNLRDRLALKTLVMPGGLGSTMKVLILGKGVGAPVLSGCSYRMRVT